MEREANIWNLGIIINLKLTLEMPFFILFLYSVKFVHPSSHWSLGDLLKSLYLKVTQINKKNLNSNEKFKMCPTGLLTMPRNQLAPNSQTASMGPAATQLSFGEIYSWIFQYILPFSLYLMIYNVPALMYQFLIITFKYKKFLFNIWGEISSSDRLGN